MVLYRWVLFEIRGLKARYEKNNTSAQAFRRHVLLNILERQGANLLVAFHHEKIFYIYKTYDATNPETTKHKASHTLQTTQA